MRIFKYFGVKNNEDFICIEFSEKKTIILFEKLVGYLLTDEIEIYQSKDKKNTKWNIKIFFGDKTTLNWKNSIIHISYSNTDLSRFQSTMDLIVILSHLIELENIILNGVIPIHSAAITKDGVNASLFIGNNGNGKTTTAIQMSKILNYDLISVDKTHLKGNLIVGGTKFLWTKKKSYIANNYINDSAFSEAFHVPSTDNDFLYVFPLNILNCKTSIDYPYNIEKIVFVEYNSSSNLEIKRISKKYAKLRLYQQLIYFFYTWPGVVLGSDQPLPTFGYDEVIKHSAVNTANILIENSDLFIAKGNLEHLTQLEITRKFNE